jgi:hypothetical protein
LKHKETGKYQTQQGNDTTHKTAPDAASIRPQFIRRIGVRKPAVPFYDAPHFQTLQSLAASDESSGRDVFRSESPLKV